MTNPVERHFTSAYDNQSHLDDHPPEKKASVATSPPRHDAALGTHSLTALKTPSSAARFARAKSMPEPKKAPPTPVAQAGLARDAAKAFLPKFLGPAEPAYKVAVLWASHPASCAAVAGGAMVAGAGYLVAEAIFGAEAGPLPPEPGGACTPEAPAKPEAPTEPEFDPNDPCASESSLHCLPRAFRDGVNN
ncbi:MAG TPA: hypothetical protein PKA88_10185 [Polyangiaceae bacterium]|nr:hypothetical protein [Polyangiaceae bacterium]